MRLIRLLHALLRQTEVRDTNMSLSIQKNILWFEVSVDDVLIVQGFDGANDLGAVQFRTVLVELLVLA